ncbi:MAG TPA: GMC family oxidoreductase [Bryobacteraceae bacterium]|nr:GMC family oxidoreductase [Bryobacteraceae bacterium]
MALLSTTWGRRKPRYDCIIVGSGYGGAISAARLAGAGLNPSPSVCVLERGREWPIGQFPDTLPRFVEELRSPVNPLGLYDLVNYPDISVIKGNGLGGTSLVNANVALIPEQRAFQQAGWPDSLTRDELLPYYEKARAVLNPSPHPRFANLPKREALEARARELGATVEALPITVNFENRPDNGHGVAQPACIDCGDCVTGCNTGAKNTLYMNYLPMAKSAGAEIFTQTEVEWIEKIPAGGWRVHGTFRPDHFGAQPFTIAASRVILAAGAINSTEILLRSAAHGLSVSTRVGEGFSGNGDFFGVAYNGSAYLQVLGFGNHPESPGAATPPGPTITTVLRYTSGEPTQHFLIEDLSFPRALFQAAQVSFAALPGTDFGAALDFQRAGRVLKDLLQAEPYAQSGALNHSMLYLVTAFDDARGRIWLAPGSGQATIDWSGAGAQAGFARVNDELRNHARALGARFIENPIWSAFGLRRLITAHPLGGCPIGEDAASGVVDEFGRVFASGSTVHEGLRVADGALVPSALGVNPFLTISALSERAVAFQIDELRGVPYPARRVAVAMAAGAAASAAAPQPPETPAIVSHAPRVGLAFDEKMSGWYAAAEAAAAAGGGAVRSPGPPAGASGCSVDLHIAIPDLGAFLDDPNHKAALTGSIRFDRFAGLAPAQFDLDPAASFFEYLRVNPESGFTEMVYNAAFRTPEGGYTLDGRKLLRRDSTERSTVLAELAEDFTTLPMVVRSAEPQPRQAGSGVLKFRILEDLESLAGTVSFLTSFRVTNAPDLEAELEARREFLAFTSDFLRTEYGFAWPGER